MTQNLTANGDGSLVVIAAHGSSDAVQGIVEKIETTSAQGFRDPMDVTAEKVVTAYRGALHQLADS